MRLLLFMVLVVAGCTPKAVQSERTSEMDVRRDAITFVTLRITAATDRTESSTIEMVDKRTSPGTFKQATSQPYTPDYLTIEYYENGVQVSSQTMEHPLYREVEYTDSTGQLQMKRVSLATSEFFFRVQQHAMSGVVKVFETLDNKPRHELFSTDLIQP